VGVGVCLGVVVVRFVRILWIRKCVFDVENIVDCVELGLLKRVEAG